MGTSGTERLLMPRLPGMPQQLLRPPRLPSTKGSSQSGSTSRNCTMLPSKGKLSRVPLLAVCTSMHGSITSIATSDYAYLTEELESLQTVLDIVNQLNLDGDSNGEVVATEHVTNDYATNAAEAKADYHGATINEQNSEGRAGEGHAH